MYTEWRKRNSMSKYKRHRPFPPKTKKKKKMTGTFEACEWEMVGDRLAQDSGTWSGYAVGIFSHGRESRCCLQPRPTSHLLRNHSWLSPLTGVVSHPSSSLKYLIKLRMPCRKSILSGYHYLWARTCTGEGYCCPGNSPYAFFGWAAALGRNKDKTITSHFCCWGCINRSRP